MEEAEGRDESVGGTQGVEGSGGVSASLEELMGLRAVGTAFVSRGRGGRGVGLGKGKKC